MASQLLRCFIVRACLDEQEFSEETSMDEEFANATKPITLSFECDGCGQVFENWDRLRQHQVDCQTDDIDSLA